MEKTMKARVQHKHDIEANWLKATNFIPLASEIIVYDPDENYDYPRIKIGDGETNINALPFVTKDYAKISDIPTKPADIGAQPAGNYLTSIPSEYVTESELNAKGYLTDYTESDPTVPAWAKASTKPTYTAAEVGALAADTLPTAINTALAQAKESGEFDGAAGADGITPHIGNNGNWYIGETDTGKPSRGADGKDGEPGKDGNDGQPGKDGAAGSPGKDGNGIKSAMLNADYTLTLTFDDGTTYTTPSIRGATGATGSTGQTGATGAAGKDGTSVTVKSVTESTADGGSNVVTFSDGKTVTIKNGSKGNKGDPYTLTNADKTTIVNAVIAALPVYNGEVL